MIFKNATVNHGALVPHFYFSDFNFDQILNYWQFVMFATECLENWRCGLQQLQ